MDAKREFFEAPEERNSVCFGGFRLPKCVEETRALVRGAPLFDLLYNDGVREFIGVSRNGGKMC